MVSIMSGITKTVKGLLGCPGVTFRRRHDVVAASGARETCRSRYATMAQRMSSAVAIEPRHMPGSRQRCSLGSRRNAAGCNVVARCPRPLRALVAALAVVPCFWTAANAQILTLPSAPANGVSGAEQQGLYATAPISLDGVTLFRVAVPANAGVNGGGFSLATRVDDIETALGQALATLGTGARQTTMYDPRTLRIHIERSGEVDALEVVDAQHSDPVPIVTVTTTDAHYGETTVDGLAAEWRGQLQSALVRALERRQPAVQRRSLVVVSRVVAVMLLGSLLAFAVRLLLARRIAALVAEVEVRGRAAAAEHTQAGDDAESPDGAHRRRRRFLAIAIRAVLPEQRLALWRAFSDSLLWALALAWFAVTIWALSLFPQTSPFAQTVTRGTASVVTTLIVFGLVNRIVDLLIARIASAWRSSPFLSSEDRARQLLRIPTIARALGGFKTFLLAFVAVLAVLSEVGIPTGSVVTIGGLAAVALSFAAQSFVRDFVNGFLVLFEDHYVVGDYVTINAYSGIVERLTLRIVQVRDSSGDLVTIPHSAVNSVANQSRDWSPVDYRVPVDPSGDVLKAIDLVRSSIDGLAREEVWHDVVLGEIEWIGLEALSKDWAIVRAVVRTAPLRQFALRRAINARVLDAFAQAGIALGAQIPGVP